MRRALLLASVLLLCAPAEASRYAVLVGHNHGRGDEVPLRYAEDDARKVFDALRRVGGFEPSRMALLLGEGSERVRSALVEMNARVRNDRPGESVLVVYYSGHADEQALHLGGEDIALEEIRALVSGSAAAFRVLIVDACRSGALTRRKGGVLDEPFDLVLERPLNAEGHVVLTATSAGEDAQESDEIKGSFFTHHLVSALLGSGDVDGDGQITLDEAYGYAYGQTVRQSSSTMAGTQHPTYRFDVTGAGALVLTEPGAAQRQARVGFPPGVSFLVLEGSADGRVLAEVPALNSRRAIALPGGTYFLRGRSADVLYEGTIVVPQSASYSVALDELSRHEYARLVRKGSERSLSHALQLGPSVRSGLMAGSLPCVGGRLSHALAFKLVTLETSLGGCGTGFENRYLKALELAGEADLALVHVVDVPFVSLSAGGLIGGAVLHQRFETQGVAPHRTGGAGLLGVRFGARLDLPLRWFLGLRVDGRSYLLRGQRGAEVGLITPLAAAVDLTLGVEL